MEALLLIVDTVAFGLLLLWVVRGRGDAGLFGWKPPPPSPPAAPGRPRR
jgi:hypothetical protein